VPETSVTLTPVMASIIEPVRSAVRPFRQNCCVLPPQTQQS
jgi:hypothetical protein